MTASGPRSGEEWSRAASNLATAPAFRLAAGLLALGCLLAGSLLSSRYPIYPVGVVAAFLLWSALNYRWPFAWLVAVPALLPICGFATWTGWFAFEEWDLLVLGAAAAGYARLASLGKGRSVRMDMPVEPPSGVAIALVIAFAVSSAVSLYRGIVDAGGFGFDWYGSYDDAMNSVRLFKSFAAALLLWPILRAALNLDRRRALDSLVLGLALGLGGVALAALWERAAFTDVLNFSSDYRTTALFWEMHVGGVALDGFLALTVPFAIWELRRSSGALRTCAALMLGGLTVYACLTTFSRGVYLALLVSLGFLWLLSICQRPDPANSLVSAGKALALSTAAAIAFYFVFRFGGYRALLAFIVTLGVALQVASGESSHRRLQVVELVPAIAIGLLLGALGAFVGQFGSKGPYIVFAIAFICNAGHHLLATDPLDSRNLIARWALLVWLAASATVVALHWGGAAAFRDSALLVVLLLVAAAVTPLGAKSWVPGSARAALGWLGVAVLLAGGVAVFAGGAYLGERFASSGNALEERERHWRESIRLLHGDAEWMLGKGLGRFPASYLFTGPAGAFPGSFSLGHDEERHFVSLAGPSYPTSWGDLFRIAQRVPAVPDIYSAMLDVRTPRKIELRLEVCEQHLLYSGACGFGSVIVPENPGWQRVSLVLDAREITGGPWYAPRLAFFAMSVVSSGQALDIDQVTLIDQSGQEILKNGNFSNGIARWIPISEMYHLPWHIENLALDLIFGQGIVGLVLFGILLLAALGRLVFGSARRHPLAPYLAAGLAGFSVVGVFDSPLDVPRVAFLFYLLIVTSLILPSGIRS